MLTGLIKFIENATTKAAAAAEARKARNAIRKNPKVTGDKEAAALSQINKKEQQVLAAIAKRTGKAASKGTTTAQDKVKREAGVDTRFSKKGYTQYMDVVDRAAFDKEMQTKLAKRAAKSGMTKTEARAMASKELQKLQEAKKVDKRTDNVVKGVRKVRDEERAKIKAKRTGKEGTRGIQRPVSENRKEAAAGRLGRSGASDQADYEVELGKAGKFTAGRKAEPSFADMETSNKGRVNRNKKVSDLETKETKGTITAEEKKQLDRLNALSKKQDVSRSRKAAQNRSTESRKDKGISLAGEGGKKITVGSKPKYKDGELIGSNTNGIVRETGEILGNPTPNQRQMAIRDLDARTNLSAEAKRNLAKLKSMSKSDSQDLTLRRMERKMRDTDRRIKGLNMAKGGMANCGASMKPAQGSSKKMAYGGMAKKKMAYGGMASKNKK